jgi:hypothetical protein
MKTKKLIETISVGVPEELKSTWKFLTSLWLSSKNKRSCIDEPFKILHNGHNTLEFRNSAAIDALVFVAGKIGYELTFPRTTYTHII